MAVLLSSGTSEQVAMGLQLQMQLRCTPQGILCSLTSLEGTCADKP